MHLKDLAIHAPAQEAVIGKLLKSSTTALSNLDPELSDWSRFRESVWKKPIPDGLEPFERKQRILRGRDAVGDVQLPPTRSVVMSPGVLRGVWGLHKAEILARSEYYETEAAALSLNRAGRDAFVVTGQPGIGKSIFLFWLLLRRLAFGLPTALQVHRDYAILFHGGGVSKFASLHNPILYGVLIPPPLDDPEEMEWDPEGMEGDLEGMEGDPEEMGEDPQGVEGEPIDRDRGRIWALVDTNQLLEKPAGIFEFPGTFFVVNSTSPRSEYLGWLSKVSSHQKFYMKPWTLSEILQARPFIATRTDGPHSERKLHHLYNKFGVSSPRELASHGDDPDSYEVRVNEMVGKINPDHLQRIFINPHFDDASHVVLVVEPLPGRRDMMEKRLASRRVFEILWEVHLKTRTADMAHYYDTFRGSAYSTASAGWVFEFRMHQVLRRQQTIRVFPITQGIPGTVNFIFKGYTKDDPVDLQLPGSGQYPLVEAAGNFIANRYHRPDATNFAAIDSLLLIHPPDGSPPILLMFQITRNTEEHDANEEGLRKVDSLNLPPDTRKYFVVVTPQGIEPTIKVPRAYFGRGPGTGWLPDGLFQVFNYPVPTDTLFLGN